MTTLVLGLVDAAVGVWLIRYALSREPRDKAGLQLVGIVLLLSAALLVGAHLLLVDLPLPVPPLPGVPAPTRV